MEVKMTMIALVTLALVINNLVLADFFYNHPSPKAESIHGSSRYKCVPGRTIIKVTEKQVQALQTGESDSDEYRLRVGPTRKKHMTVPTQDEHCKVCVCSAEGDDEYCSNRPAETVNECLMLKDIKSKYSLNLPYDHTRSLAFRIRRVGAETENKGAETANRKCVPFVSEYSNCNDNNRCAGCSRCTCTAEGKWTCSDVKECEFNEKADYEEEEESMFNEDEIFDNALERLEAETHWNNINSMRQTNHPNVPSPQKTIDHNKLIVIKRNLHPYGTEAFSSREKRSIATKNNKHNKRSIDKTSHKHDKTTNSSNNNTIKFYDTIDELNEDTLKNTNVTGTLTANKIDMIPQLAISRRMGDTDNSSKALQIEYNQPKAYNQITDNKIETTEQENKFDSSHENLKAVLGNYTQKVKDNNLSNIVVNELKKGKEVIGDASAPVTSNITFTPENDTLTAMAFIAGNLLNKLWNMEKDAFGSSMETDIMKHEKITDLLDLFKEPLNLRQEMFLKNALEHLSSALDKDKDMKTISVCEDIEKAKKLLYDTNSTSEEVESKTKAPCKQNKAKVEEDRQKTGTVKAIAKINNVLDLIKKFDYLQGTLGELKHGTKLDFNLNHTKSTSGKHEIDTILTKDEKSSLNLFGTLLEKITKLILPKRNNKKIENQIRSKNMLGGNDKLKEKFKKIYNIDLANMTVTAKDKLILDYLTHVDGNPDCVLNDNNHKITDAIPSIEGNILLNLSEFFKIKSFSDLIKLLEPEKHKSTHTPMGTTSQVDETTTAYEEKKISSSFKGVDIKKFNSTKEKLKAHFKTIIEDLVELQNAKGVSIKGNIKLADALPCLYNVLNAGRDVIVTKKDDNINPPLKIADIFNKLKKDIKAVQSRRSNDDIMAERPKSAIVWERLLKNLNYQSSTKSRRSLQSKVPKSYDKIKKIMERIENSSSSYKTQALLVPTQPAGRLMLLKALEQDAKDTINIIEDIKLSFENLSKLPAEEYTELVEFVGNIGRGINLSEKVYEKIKPELRKYFVNELNSSNKMLKNKFKKKPAVRYSGPRNEESNEVRVSRLQIVTQLIKNRMQMFIKMKEDAETDVQNDVTYRIAQRVLYYLDIGNYNLAKELYKVFEIMQKQNLGLFSNNDPANDQFSAISVPNFDGSRQMTGHQRDPFTQFEDPNKKTKHMNWVNQGHLTKQLVNMKNMGM